MADEADKGGQRKALIIGISNYTDSRLPQLDFCKNDGRNMSRVLDQAGFDISDKNKLIGRVKLDNLRKAINGFFKTQRDTAVLSFWSWSA